MMRKINNQLTSFDIAQHLDCSEAIAEYLSQVLEDGDSDEFLEAIGHIAKDTGLGRESLYKTFAAGSKPRFETVMKVMNTFGVKLQASS